MSAALHTMRFTLVSTIACSIAALTLLGGCSPYTLQGRVIRGDTSYVSVVSADDPRLMTEGAGVSQGVSGVRLKMTMDPGRLSRDVVAEEVSGDFGEFALPVDRVGAGLLQMDMSLLARRSGFISAEGFFRLPDAKNQRVLVVVRTGTDPVGSDLDSGSIEDDLKRFGP